MTITYGELRKGLPIELDGEPYAVVEYKSHKMQQRAPVMQVRFRSLRTGKVVDKSFQGFDVKFTPAAVERRTAQYIYEDGGLYYFMDNDTYEQFPLSSEQIDRVPAPTWWRRWRPTSSSMRTIQSRSRYRSPSTWRSPRHPRDTRATPPRAPASLSRW